MLDPADPDNDFSKTCSRGLAQGIFLRVTCRPELPPSVMIRILVSIWCLFLVGTVENKENLAA